MSVKTMVIRHVGREQSDLLAVKDDTIDQTDLLGSKDDNRRICGELLITTGKSARICRSSVV